MARTARFYQRLTRSRSGIGSYTSLWLGPDHLLLVTSSGYSESYQRFYFRDIQCLVAADSIRYGVFNAVFGTILGFCGIAAAIAASSTGVSPWILLFLLPALLLLLWNLYLGRTCKVTLMSGVQSVVLPPLSRFRRTRKVFARLVPLIEAAQAALTPPPLAPPPPPAAATAGAEPPTPAEDAPATSDRTDAPDQSDRSAASAQPAVQPAAQ
ncbi:MAG: hypothetical protein IPL39_04720 [Opitutaceae bacterium]|nr:hypothetical protein [Opitutaceae bacterium]